MSTIDIRPGDRIATRGQLFGSITVDAFFLVGSLWALYVLTSGALPASLSWLLLVTTAIGLVAAWWAARVLTGRSLGHCIWGLRTANAATGLPGRWPGFRSIDIRRGPDPLYLTPHPVRLTPATPLPTQMELALVATRDDGTRERLLLPCVVGRDPRAADPYHIFAMPDIDRSVSRTHLLLALDQGGLVVTDLGSGKGTTALSMAGERPLAPHTPARFAVAPGFHLRLRLGKRVMAIDALPIPRGTA